MVLHNAVVVVVGRKNTSLYIGQNAELLKKGDHWENYQLSHLHQNVFSDHNHHRGAELLLGTFPSAPTSTRLLLEHLDGVTILHVEALWRVALIDSGPVK